MFTSASVLPSAIQRVATNIMLYIPCARVLGLKIDYSRLVFVRSERYGDIYTQLPRRLNGNILQNDSGKVIALLGHSVSSIQRRDKVARMAREGEKRASVSRDFLGVVYNLTLVSVSAYLLLLVRDWGSGYRRKGYSALSLLGRWGWEHGITRDTGRGSRRVQHGR